MNVKNKHVFQMTTLTNAENGFSVSFRSHQNRQIRNRQIVRFIWVWHQKLACLAISELIYVYPIWLHLKIECLFCVQQFFSLCIYFVSALSHKLRLRSFVKSNHTIYLSTVSFFLYVFFLLLCSYLFSECQWI